MALQLLSLGKSKQPIKNVVYSSPYIEDNLRVLTESIFRRIKETPELVSMIDTAVTDHYLGPVDFFNPDGKPLGSTKLKQINTFWSDHNIQGDAFFGQGVDLLVDGSSFGWHIEPHQLLSAKQKEAITKIKQLNPSMGEYAEETSNLPISISYLAASTVTIKYDDTSILYYIQDSAGKRVKWDTNQVVHIKLMEFNGEIRGFSALKALTKEIVMMYMLKENILAAMQNGGHPDNIIYLKGIGGVSKSKFSRLQSALESFSHLKKSHGNMAIDTEVGVIPVGVAMKDMEYRELAMFIISEFALALGLPTSRVPFLMTGSGGSSNKGELSGNSEDSYQSKINSRRLVWENCWNKVFRKAGFIFKFRRTNLQDDVRETQASTQRAAYVQAVQSSLSQVGKQLILQSHLALLSGTKMNINEEDVEEKEMQMEQFGQFNPAGMGNPMQPDNKSKSRVGQDYQHAKEKTAFNNGVSS